MKEDFQKALKKLTLVFLSNPVTFNGKSYQKQKGPETNDQLLFRLRNKFRKILLLIICLMKYYKAVFELFQKLHLETYASQLMTSSNYSTSICPFESGKCGKEKKKL